MYIQIGFIHAPAISISDPPIACDSTECRCDLIGGSMVVTCHEYVDAYATEVFTLLDVS